jgi:hypothetical protein
MQFMPLQCPLVISLAVALSAALSACSSDDSGAAGPSAQQLLSAIATCTDTVAGPFAKDNCGAATVNICRKNMALFWTADMDIDCDGKRSTQCNADTDPSYMGQTSIEDSKGDPLDAATLPFVVLPRMTDEFDFRDFNITTGMVAAIIYKDKAMAFLARAVPAILSEKHPIPWLLN